MLSPPGRGYLSHGGRYRVFTPTVSITGYSLRSSEDAHFWDRTDLTMRHNNNNNNEKAQKQKTKRRKTAKTKNEKTKNRKPRKKEHIIEKNEYSEKTKKMDARGGRRPPPRLMSLCVCVCVCVDYFLLCLGPGKVQNTFVSDGCIHFLMLRHVTCF